MPKVHRVHRIGIPIAAMVVPLLCFLLIIRYRRIETASRTNIGMAQSLSSFQMPRGTTPVSVLVDLDNASPTRGAPDVEHGPAPLVIPSSPSVNLIFKLPIGSENRIYSMKLNSQGSVVWLVTAKPHFNHGRALLHTHADFSRVSPGGYELAVVAKDFRVTVPVLVKNASQANIPQP